MLGGVESEILEEVGDSTTFCFSGESWMVTTGIFWGWLEGFSLLLVARDHLLVVSSDSQRF